MFIKKLLLAICTIIMLVPVSAFAATEYTITVRAGSNNVGGTFTDEYKNELESLKASGKISDYSFASDKVTISVPEGADAPTLPDKLNYIQISDIGYYILPTTKWGYSKNQGTISRNEDIVVQYGSLINGVEYTIYYIEKGTARNVAMPVIGRVEATTKKVSANAIAISGYRLDAASPASQTLLLDSTISDNKIIFEYNYVGPGSTTSSTTEITYTAGDVTTTYLETEVPTYVATPTAGGGGAGGDAVAAGGGAADAGDAGDAGDEAGGAVEIPEAEVPLAATPSETDDEETPIDDGKVPLAAPIEQKTNWLLWIACIAGAAVIVMGTTYIGIRSRKAKAIDFSEDITTELADNHKKES